MLLSVGERLLLLNVIPPAEGPFIFLKVIRKLREDLGFSEEEVVDLELKKFPDRVVWNQNRNPMKEIEIGPIAAGYLSKSILAATSIREEHMEFYARFVQEDASNA